MRLSMAAPLFFWAEHTSACGRRVTSLEAVAFAYFFGFFNRNVTFIVTRYSTTLPFSTTTF